MQPSTQPQSHTTAQASAVARPEKPVVIATRKRCEADGVGLSHYILMDRKPA